MSVWLSVDEPETSKSEVVSGGGSKTVRSESPFNIPEGIRIDLDPVAKLLVLEFRYLGDAAVVDEPLKNSTPMRGALVSHGRYSQRIYRIELNNVAELNAESAKQVEAVIIEFDKTNLRPKALGRYRILLETWQEIAGGLLSRAIA